MILFILFCATVSAQDSLVATEKPKNTFTQQDIIVDDADIEKFRFETNFKEKYKSDEFVYELKPKEKNAWDRFKEWLAGIFKKIFRFSDNEKSMNFVGYLLKFIAFSIIVFVVYLIVKIILNKEGQWIFGKNSDRKMVRYDDVEKNIRLVDFEKLIKETIQSGQQRLAVRYYYLWLLKKMSEREIIEWDVEKTNSDYFYEIKNESQKENFGYLSYLYNNIWYGEFDIDTATFEKAKEAFEKTIKSI